MSGVLARKIVREVFRSIGQYASVACLVTLGVAFLVGSYSVYRNLVASYEGSYDKLGFEDFSIRFHSAPSRVVDRVRALPGIAAAEGRLVEETALEVEGIAHTKIVGRVIGIPTERPLTTNRLRLIAGREARPRGREVLLEANFATHHGIKPGRTVKLIRGSTSIRLRVVGIAQSDEYLYVVRSKQDLIAVPGTFGVLFMDEDRVAELFGRAGEIDEIHATLTSPDLLTSTLRATKEILRAYEPEEPVLRADQPSYQMLQQDVKGFQSYAILFPLLFLSVAVLSVFSMLTRVVHAQRPQIGLLRSLGLGRAQIVLQVLAATMVVGAIAGIAGAALGIWLGAILSRLYMAQLQVPFPEIVPRWGVAIAGAIVGFGACALAGLIPALAAARIQPAEAMRPPSPEFARTSIRLDALFPGLSALARVPLRNVFRQPRRSLSTLVGVVSAICLTMTAGGMLDSMTYALDNLLVRSYSFDLRGDFTEFQSKRVVTSVRTWPGVLWAEGVLELPVEFRHRGRTYEALMNGVEPNTRLRRVVDAQGRRLPIPEKGALFGPTLRKRLALQVGDRLEVRLPEELTPERSIWHPIVVAGFNDDAIGTQATLARSEAQRMFRTELGLPGNAVTSVLVKTAPDQVEPVRRRLLDLPHAGSALSMAMMRTMIEGLVSTSRRFIAIMLVFAAILAFATIFNVMTVNVLERQAEIATLRTIGVSRRQIGTMILVENLALTVLGIAMGLPIGRAFVALFWQAAQTEEQQDLFTFQVMVHPTTYLMAGFGVLLVTAVSAIPALRAAQALDLVRAVKERSA
ncbi:MAG TPA: FtsX-like permease family protein [Fimbriimonadaceae bacterium]|nr:FtsX-like permease family protein [Fimbriimonadaceae bacterium]